MGGMNMMMGPMGFMGMQNMMRAMMGGNPAAQQAMMRQQQLMMRQFQQNMVAQMGAMQQYMMGMGQQQQAFANAMRMSNTGEGGCPGLGSDPEETQRQMGRQAYANAVAAMNRREIPPNEEEDDGPSGPSPSVHHPNYRPAESEQVPGITDRRYEGKLKLWFEDKGYGFIECAVLRAKYPDVDVFLHQNQKRHFQKGDLITFGVFMNFRGKPQATELRRAKEVVEDPGEW